MRINAFRKELVQMIGEASVRRPAAIRRSIRPDWLYASDLPSLCSGEETHRILDQLSGIGWTWIMEKTDWILFRKSAEEPPEDWFEGPFGPEAACCLSLITRHADTRPDGADPVRFRLIRAGESGEAAYEKTCAELHREWAALLRERQRLPGISPRFFGE